MGQLERGDDVADAEFLLREEQGQYAKAGLVCKRFEYIGRIFHAAKCICLDGYSQAVILESTGCGGGSFRDSWPFKEVALQVSELP